MPIHIIDLGEPVALDRFSGNQLPTVYNVGYTPRWSAITYTYCIIRGPSEVRPKRSSPEAESRSLFHPDHEGFKAHRDEVEVSSRLRTKAASS